MSRRGEKLGVVLYRHGIDRARERIHLDLVHRPFIVLPCVTAHRESAGRNLNEFHKPHSMRRTISPSCALC